MGAMGNDARLALENAFGTRFESPAPARNERPTRTIHSTPVASLRYRIEFTASQEYVDRLEEARNLLQHQIPNRDVARIHELAMAVFVEHLQKRRRAATKGSPAPVEGRASIGDHGSAAKRTGRDRDAMELIAVPEAFEESAPERMSQAVVADGSKRTSEPPVVEESAPERMSEPSSSGERAGTVVTVPSAPDVSALEERMSDPPVVEESAPEANDILYY